jgi:hypothetical protein
MRESGNEKGAFIVVHASGCVYNYEPDVVITSLRLYIDGVARIGPTERGSQQHRRYVADDERAWVAFGFVSVVVVVVGDAGAC